MSIWGGGYAAATGAVIGDMISANQQEQTNAEMIAQQNKVMDWETQMSNTAMTRRIDDLKQAGVNPLLAISEGGASTPGMSPVSLGNPGASFGNLGSQLAAAGASAQQVRSTDQGQQSTDANVDLANAQAAKARADTVNALGVDQDVKRATASNLLNQMNLQDAQAEASKAQASLSTSEVALNQERLPQIKAQVANLVSATSLNQAETALRGLQAAGQGLSNAQFSAMSPDIVSTAQANQKAAWSNQEILQQAVQKAQQEGWLYSGGLGSTATVIEHLFNLLHVGANLTK